MIQTRQMRKLQGEQYNTAAMLMVMKPFDPYGNRSHNKDAIKAHDMQIPHNMPGQNELTRKKTTKRTIIQRQTKKNRDQNL